ncbi:hypothetical protein N7505_001366 [Penicillium chrysogenum]|uniref:Ankyrin repeat protein n=1 Tax=Penicillium chrysogenum TaxID=5076 RepID=A0ABQ8WXG2_PENCH|nr:hypothetical protein N7505_001366 [Penicillium chrysogenum]
MFLLNLPDEILLCIADSLDQAKDLLALARLNRAANNLFLDCLYRFNVRRQRSSALFWGVRRGKLKFVEMMLRDYQADANTTDGRSRTPIFHALRTKNETIICTLLNFDPRLDITDVKNRSDIWYAIAFCDENLVRVLLERGSDIRTPEYKLFSPFSLAIAKKIPRITGLLLLHSDPNSRKTLLEDVTVRNRLLRQAVQASLHDVIALLVAHGADSNSRNRDGQRLLHQATKNGDRNVVQQLLAYEEIFINATDRQSCTALHIAAEYGCTSVAKCLLAKCGIDINARDRYGRTAFHIAAEYGNKSITELLFAYGAVDINAPDANGATALCLAAAAKHTPIAPQILAEDHVDVDMVDQIGGTALHHAASTGNIPIACVLLAKEDLDPNIRDDQGWPPLTYAAFNGDLRVVELFLARGDIQANVQQAPPLFHAAKKGHVEVVRQLLQFDTIDVNQQFWNSSPLCLQGYCLSAQRPPTPISKLIWETLHFPWPLTMAIWLSLYLLQDEIAKDDLDQNKRTPLSWAAQYSALRAVKILLDNGAEINSMDDMYTTPLSWLVQAGRSPNRAAIINYLRSNGATRRGATRASIKRKIIQVFPSASAKQPTLGEKAMSLPKLPHVVRIKLHLKALFIEGSYSNYILTAALYNALESLCRHEFLETARSLCSCTEHMATTDTYNILLRAAARRQDVAVFRHFLRTMLRLHMHPNPETWLALLSALVDPSEKAQLIEHMVQRGQMPNLSTIHRRQTKVRF